MDITQTPSPNFNMRKHKLDMLADLKRHGSLG